MKYESIKKYAKKATLAALETITIAYLLGTAYLTTGPIRSPGEMHQRVEKRIGYIKSGIEKIVR